MGGAGGVGGVGGWVGGWGGVKWVFAQYWYIYVQKINK